MVGILKRVPGGCIPLLVAAAAAAQELPRADFAFGADVAWVDSSGYPSYLEYSAGKLRHDPDNDGLLLSRAWFDYRYRVLDTVTAQVAGEAYDDDIGGFVGLTEAYLEWKPLAVSPTRFRLKLGAFYPRLSLENVDRGWSSLYTISSSAINTWVGEEIRVFGTELALTRRPQFLEGLHSFSVFGAAYGKNDPAGTLLSWKGWSLHDRQTRFNDEIPLPPVPQIQPDGAFRMQDPYEAPFREIDDRIGWYLGAEWAIDRRLMFRAMHYDNRADPESYEDGQFGWYTEFDSLGLQLSLPGEVGLISQWMDGHTVWGRYYEGVRNVDADFASWFALLTRAFGRHRVSLRYDSFEVAENDVFPMDDNDENGHAWTAAWRFDWSERIALAAEWLEISTHRPAWAYFGFEESKTETQLQLELRLRFTI